jgi:hypothetical protein
MSIDNANVRGGAVVWLTGPIARAQASLPRAVAAHLAGAGDDVELVAAHIIRCTLGRGLGDSSASRQTLQARLIALAALLARRGATVIVEAGSAFDGDRDAARRACGTFVEVRVNDAATADAGVAAVMRALETAPRAAPEVVHEPGPPRFRLVNLGLPKTGTTTLAAMFPRCRAAHEFWFEPTIDLLHARAGGRASDDDVAAFLRWREEAGRLEVDSASFLYHAAGLVTRRPGARYVVTWRPFAAWMDSLLNFVAAHARRLEARGDGWPAWETRVGELMFGAFDPAWFAREASIATVLPDLARRCLTCWRDGHARLLAAMPAGTLFVQTSDLDRAAPALARHAGLAVGAVVAARRNVGGGGPAWSARVDSAFAAEAAGAVRSIEEELAWRSARGQAGDASRGADTYGGSAKRAT